jgi:hypothetical protein
MTVGKIVGNSVRARELIYDEEGRIKEGVVVVKLVRGHGPYGYQVHYVRGENRHQWEYLGRAESGVITGTYAPSTPLKFYKGRMKHLEDRELVLVGNWDNILTTTSLDSRLEGEIHLREVIA